MWDFLAKVLIVGDVDVFRVRASKSAIHKAVRDAAAKFGEVLGNTSRLQYDEMREGKRASMVLCIAKEL